MRERRYVFDHDDVVSDVQQKAIGVATGCVTSADADDAPRCRDGNAAGDGPWEIADVAPTTARLG
jgi:hypothetical protein